ncbi:MAG: hypothetical protein AB8G17_06590 [Gammaproteobacteria bacterium]
MMIGIGPAVSASLTVLLGFRASASFSVADDFSTGVVGTINTSGAEGAVTLVGGAVTDQAGTGGGLFSVATNLTVTFDPQSLGTALTTDGASASTTYTVELNDGTTTIDVPIRVTLTKADQAPVAAGGLADLTLGLDNAMAAVDVSTDFTDADDTLTFTASGLPAGLSLSSAGSLTGTPTALVTGQVVTITATDAGGQTATSAFQVTIEAAGNNTVTLSSPVATAFEPINAELSVVTDTAGTVNYSAVPQGGGTTVSGSMTADAPGTVEKVITGLDNNKIYDVAFSQTDASSVSASVDLTRNKMIVWVGGRSVAQGGLAAWDSGTQFPAGTRFYNTNTGLWEYPTEGSVAVTGLGMSPWLTFAIDAAAAYPNLDLYFYNAAIFGQSITNIQSGTDIFETGITEINALIAGDSSFKLGLIFMIHGSSAMQGSTTGIDQYFDLQIPQYRSDIVSRITGASDKTPMVWGSYVQSFVDTRLNGAYFTTRQTDLENDYIFNALFDGSTGVTLLPDDEVHPDAAGNRLMGTRVLAKWTEALGNTTRRAPVAAGAIPDQTDLSATAGSITAPVAAGAIPDQSDVRV